MKTLATIAIALSVLSACSKSDPAKSHDELAWQPLGYEQLSAAQKKALACCEAALLVVNPKATRSDFNLECSGPASAVLGSDMNAIWNDAACEQNVKSRAAKLGTKAPPACTW